jgi:hypothetical protein
MLAERLGVYLGSDKLERLSMVEDKFEEYTPFEQFFYYQNGQVSITDAGIELGAISNIVWENRVLRRRFTRKPVIAAIKHLPNGDFDIIEDESGAQCEFWRFLKNTSNFWTQEGYELTPEDEREYRQHLVNKITAIGYLLCDWKNKSELKAVVAMDSTLGEVGQSKGRSGKSLIGYALKMMLEQTFIDGKGLKNDDDFMFSDVTPRTRNVLIDDVRVNFDFERLFAAITGDMNVNPKTKSRFTIPADKSPKIFVTTNHAIKDMSDSAAARMALISFSAWYNVHHNPESDFGHKFWVDWDNNQWELFDNFMAECVMYYYRSIKEGWADESGAGVVAPPMKNLRRKALRQLMSEAFFQWGETYFEESAGHLNNRENRQDMYNAFHETFPDRKYDVTPSSFRRKLIAYCEYKGLHLNTSRPNIDNLSFSDWRKRNSSGIFVGEPDKSGGKEYFTVVSEAFAEKQPF